MRVGQNPAKFVKDVVKPARVTVAVLNYIPFLNGFYAEMLDVLKANLNSIWENTDLPYDLMVFDNASCGEVRQYLLDEHEAGRIQYLVLSEKNVGKGGAWNVILGGAPGEIITYTDNDCFFHKGWLSRSVELLETYPNVGMVTARPFHTKPEFLPRPCSGQKLNLKRQLRVGNSSPGRRSAILISAWGRMKMTFASVTKRRMPGALPIAAYPQW
jgi:hypothetical protein